MKIPYFPGCTLTNKARGLNDMGKQSLQAFGVELVELEQWYCCQANFSMVTDNIMNHLGPLRTLISARKLEKKVVVLCSTCYYVLKRVNYLLERDEKKREVAFDFLEEEYQGPIEVVHFLEIIRDEIGFERIKEKVTLKLSDLAVAPYYGCQLLRPGKELELDNLYSPVIFENFIHALGCKSIEYPLKDECCGSFLTTFNLGAAKNCVTKVLGSAKDASAEIITTSCPLCNFNLDWHQNKESAREQLKGMPVLYLTELMALALGINVPDKIWDEHIIDPRPFLESKGLLNPVSENAAK